MILHFSHIGLTDGRTFMIPFGFGPDGVALVTGTATATMPPERTFAHRTHLGPERDKAEYQTAPTHYEPCRSRLDHRSAGHILRPPGHRRGRRAAADTGPLGSRAALRRVGRRLGHPGHA